MACQRCKHPCNPRKGKIFWKCGFSIGKVDFQAIKSLQGYLTKFVALCLKMLVRCLCKYGVSGIVLFRDGKFPNSEKLSKSLKLVKTCYEGM